MPDRGRRPRCYIASPLGFTDGGTDYYTTTYLPALSEVVDPVDPWSLTTEEEVQRALAAGTERELWLTVAQRNADAIRSSEYLAAYLEGQEVDSGTAAEVGYATALGRRCFGLRSDLRRAGEQSMALNLQVEGFIVQSGGVVVATLHELVEALRAPR